MPDDKNFSRDKKSGFTLAELMIAVTLAAILSAAAFILINPSTELARGRNSRRTADLNAIINAIGQNTADNRGIFSCASGAIPSATTRMASSSPNYNIAPCLVPAYLAVLPYDPNALGARYASTTDYDTAYSIIKNSQTGRITLSAPFAEGGASISLTR